MQNVLMLFAGLAFFLFGMEKLGSLLYAFAGGSLKNRLKKYTGNDATRVAVGFFITTLFQSSSATTVILVSMTSVGLISVVHSLSFLIGANIGSITTAWIVAIKITKAGIYMFTLGAIGKLAFKNRKLNDISLFLIGLGLIFFGLEMMSGSLSFLSESPDVVKLISGFDASESVWSMILLTMFGVLFTALIQSSGATAAMVIAVTAQGIMPIHSGAAIVLGSTLGTTITAFLASIGSSAEGKRTAYLQIIINVVEMVIGIIVFYPSVALLVVFGKAIGNVDAGFMIAVYMTFLKVILAATVFPFRNRFVSFSEKLAKKKYRLITTPIEVPAILDEDTPEIIRKKLYPATEIYMDYVRDMLAYSYIISRKPDDRALYSKVVRYEEVLDEGHKEMVLNISKTRNKNSSVLWLFLKMSDEAESMGDHAREIAKYGMRLESIKDKLSKEQTDMLHDCFTKVFLNFHEVCIKRNYDCELVARCEMIERYLRKKKREFYFVLCQESDHDHEKRLIVVDLLSEYSKFNHSIKRILQVNIDYNAGREAFLWGKCPDGI
jgi:phosphate:Na+ symporter